MQGVNQGRLFFSNHLEALLVCLEKNLFIGDDPFEERLVVIPSKEMGRWVKQKLADSLGIAANIRTLFLHEALEIELPSRLSLATQIYEEIADLDYVQGDPKRQMVLAQTLAAYFQRYALYGVTFQEDWQKRVWEKVYPQVEWKAKGGKRLHLFSFSHIPEKLFHVLQNSDFYHLSPCAAFWSDFRKREGEHLFLANLGKVGREFAKMVEESGIETHELYIRKSGKSALHQFQQGMLELDSKRIEGDESVAVHVVTNRHREIEVLYEELLRLDVEPKDVLVMAPDITLYTPYIEAIFSNYQITDMPPTLNEQVRGLFLLFDLPKKRWSSLALLELFRHPLFYRQWSEEQVDQIREWIQRTGIRWGYDAHHRGEILGVEEKGATWEQGFDQLLEDLAMGQEPLVPFTDAELLGELIESVRQLYNMQPKGERTASEWVECVREISSYFFLESEERLWLFEKLESVRSQTKMPFEPFRLLLEDELKGEGLTIHPNQLQTYHFCSMLPMRSIPAKVIWVLGMDQEAFPRLDKKLSFDLSRQSHTYSPTRLDFDRYLFLESMLSAREKFVISYTGRDPLDNQEKPPSSVVSDFLEFVDVTPVVHPPKAYDALYFDGTLTSTSETDFQMALATQKKEKKEAPFSLHIQSVELPVATIELSQLQRLAKSPLKHYYQHKLGMRFWEEPGVKEEEEFLLSPLALAHLRTGALRDTVENVIKRVKREGNYPLGVFEKVANEKCKEIVEVHTQTHEVQTKVGSVAIVGEIPGVFEHTLYLPAKSDLRGILSNWPLLLLFSQIGDTVFFVRDKKQKTLKFEKEALEHFVRYFFLAQENVSPLFPAWIKPIVEENIEKLEVEILTPSFDHSLLWACSGRDFPDLQKLITTWKPYAEELFHGWV